MILAADLATYQATQTETFFHDLYRKRRLHRLQIHRLC